MSDKVENGLIESLLKEQFGDAIRSVEESYGMLDIVVKREKIIEIITWLRDSSLLSFNFLTSLCGMHFPDNKGEELGVVYHMHSFANNKRIRLHILFSISDPVVPTVTGLYRTANWMERETFDFFGIKFTGHPDLRRILNMEDMQYHPLLKQYPLEDGTRTDKEDKYFGR
ncbi:MAG TPA: NADH-quinone oxidoreductase subunit C [Chitinophagales bacterium]|nr:NADH-quinone oxidoreductase subunit C [Chitinophagales bacterium]HRG26628.1 NADH-quinone oxidoreductase subunit C [Chitinophagales bacterium]HRG85012.1 NADH-quinone oxidoreductase subunit C [Chitinophagales bacterium]HRH52303.1 NADH-quinone oxidoreductase subunit C [Chitinophagales bacterium]